MWVQWRSETVKLHWSVLTCTEWTFFPQDGDAELGAVAAGCWECVVTELLSALVLWTETRREEGTEPPAGDAGPCERYQPHGSSPAARLSSNRHVFVSSAGGRRISTRWGALQCPGLCRGVAFHWNTQNERIPCEFCWFRTAHVMLVDDQVKLRWAMWSHFLVLLCFKASLQLVQRFRRMLFDCEKKTEFILGELLL